jgi:hypothetical protein
MTTPGLIVPRGEAGQLLQAHYHNAQKIIAVHGSRAIRTMWNQAIVPAEFSKSWYNVGPVINTVVSTHNQMSAAQAAQFYANSRVVAGFSHRPVPGHVPDETYIGNVVGAMGPGQFYHFLDGDYTEDESSNMALDALLGAAERMILMGGRDTVTDASVQDPVAEGWERIATAGACDFCTMLAGRGAVYKEDTADFQAHDHCGCVAAPVFSGGESE